MCALCACVCLPLEGHVADGLETVLWSWRCFNGWWKCQYHDCGRAHKQHCFKISHIIHIYIYILYSLLMLIQLTKGQFWMVLWGAQRIAKEEKEQDSDWLSTWIGIPGTISGYPHRIPLPGLQKLGYKSITWSFMTHLRCVGCTVRGGYTQKVITCCTTRNHPKKPIRGWGIVVSSKRGEKDWFHGRTKITIDVQQVNIP